MSEAEFSVIQNMISVIEALSYAAIFTVFYHPFMVRPQEREKSRIKKILMVFAIYSAVYLVGSITDVILFGWLSMAIVIALAAAASRFLELDARFSFLLGVLFFSMRSLSMMVLQSCVTWL